MGSVLAVRVTSRLAAAAAARQTSTAVASSAPMRRNMSGGRSVSASDVTRAASARLHFGPIINDAPNTAAIRLARRVREDARVQSFVVDMGRVSFPFLGYLVISVVDGEQRACSVPDSARAAPS